MEEIRLNDIPPRGLKGLMSRFFDWRHLIAVGAVCCLGLSLLFYLYIAVTRALVSYVLFPLSLLLFGVMLWQGRLLRYPDIKILLAAFVWMNLSFLLNANRASLSDCIPYYANACAVALLCYPLAYALSETRRIKSLDLLAGLWTIPVACSSVFGIALALTRTLIYRASDNAPMGMFEGRLCLILDSNMYGMLLCMGLCLVMYLLLGRRRPLVKALLILAAIFMYVALSLTGCRTAQYAMLFAALFFAAILVWSLMKKQKKLVRLAAGAAAGVVFFAVLFVGYQAVNRGLNAVIAAVPAAPAVVEPAAVELAADSTMPEAGSDIDTSRDVSNTESVSIRFEAWRYALSRLPEEKDVLLRGATPVLSLSMFADPAHSINHFHNAYLGVLLSYGLPGFIIMLAFFVYLLVCSCRLMFSPRADLSPAIRFLPAILLSILIINLLEEMLFTRSFVSELEVWLAIIGGYAAVLSRRRIGGASDAA